MPINLVIIGHVGYAHDETPQGAFVNLGGSGYACARGATVGKPANVGLMATIGQEFNQNHLRDLGINLQGLVTIPGESPHLYITQHPDGSRTWRGSLGVAAHAHTGQIPRSYRLADHVHLGTMPLWQQRDWLLAVRKAIPSAKISIDMFETSIGEEPGLARSLCHQSDLVFLNDAEYAGLFYLHPAPEIPMVLKHGSGGATYISGGQKHHAGAPQVELVDTTGPGELLAGAFLALREAGLPVAAALELSVGIASAKVQELGVDGQLTKQAIQRVRQLVASKPFMKPV